MVLFSIECKSICFICRKRAFERNCIARNPTRLSNPRRSAIINVVAKSKSISANKKGSDIDDDEEVISPEVCVGPAKNETHSVRVFLYYQKTCLFFHHYILFRNRSIFAQEMTNCEIMLSSGMKMPWTLSIMSVCSI